MNKEELLQELTTKVRSGEISLEEVRSRLGLTQLGEKEGIEKSGNKSRQSSHFSVTKVLYFLGAAIVVIGILIFVVQIWDDLGSIGRITITFGLGMLMATFGSVLLKQKPEDSIGSIFHVIGGVLIRGGAVVTLNELSSGTASLWPLVITFGAIFAFYVALTFIHKNAILTFFAISNGTAFVYLLFAAIIDNRYSDLYAYLTMVIGVSYILLAHEIRDGWNKGLIGALYFFGITGLLGAAFSQVFDSVFWQMLYFIIVIGGLFLAVYVRNRIILTMSTLFLIAHISYITSEYFANSLGWPISLVILGFIFIGLGYTSLTINKRYISRKNKSFDKATSQATQQKQMGEPRGEIIPQELKNYVAESRSKKMPDNIIYQKLLEVGWAEDLISRALNKR